jgi:enoyl-CoA hydratase/carnithine racemase
MWEELRRIGRDLPGDVRVVVVRGQGRAFSAGLDLSSLSADPDADGGGAGAGDAGAGDAGAGGGGAGGTDGTRFTFVDLAARSDADAAEVIARFQEGFSWLRRPDLVSIAAVRGHAIGAGFQLALACDLRVLAEDAQLTMAEVSLGLVPDLGGTKRLVELVGYSRALDICVTGRRVGAGEAERLGLATSVVPTDDLDKAVMELTAQILSASRDAVVEIKALLAAASRRDFAEQEAAERHAQVRRMRDLVGLGE